MQNETNSSVGKVKPLDLSALLRHAFLAGAGLDVNDRGAQRVPDDILAKWTMYDPESCEAFGRLSSALAAAAPQKEPPLGNVRAALAAAADALRPMADAVFNDNGDMTVNLFTPTGEECIEAYFAEKRVRAAFSTAAEGRNDG